MRDQNDGLSDAQFKAREERLKVEFAVREKANAETWETTKTWGYVFLGCLGVALVGPIALAACGVPLVIKEGVVSTVKAFRA